MSVFCLRIKGMLLTKVTDYSYTCGWTCKLPPRSCIVGWNSTMLQTDVTQCSSIRLVTLLWTKLFAYSWWTNDEPQFWQTLNEHFAAMFELKPVSSPRRAEFCWWLRHFTYSDVLAFDTFFSSDEAWFHLDDYVYSKIIVFGVWRILTFFKQCCCIPKKFAFGAPWVSNE